MAVEEPDFEAVVRVGDTLLALLQAARNKGINDGCTVPEGCRHRCPLCPFRVFRVKEHVRKDTSQKKQFCCSGTKQLRVMQALLEEDQMRKTQPCARFWRRSATVLRASLEKPDGKVNRLDRQMRLVLTIIQVHLEI